ncbi:MAG: ankyrin repeat domain-containing protein [Alphaproteobacteria bacterium]|nr:ankyrin repeat domain-containing protein [Alphaproteobacteria bacterium]
MFKSNRAKWLGIAWSSISEEETWKALEDLLFKSKGFDKYSGLALESACCWGRSKIVDKLLELDVDVNFRDYAGKTPLMWTASAGNTELTEKLIKAGADVNLFDYYGYTALIEAATYGQKDTVKQLLAAGANVNAKREYGNTALSKAVAEKHTEIADILRQAQKETYKKGRALKIARLQEIKEQEAKLKAEKAALTENEVAKSQIIKVQEEKLMNEAIAINKSLAEKAQKRSEIAKNLIEIGRKLGHQQRRFAASQVMERE